MKPLLTALLVILAIFFIVPVVTVDRVFTEGRHTIQSGQTIRGGLIITEGEVTVEEGARVDGGVFISSGVLNVNGEIGGAIFSISGDVRLGPRAVVGGHITVTSVPFEEPADARI